MVDVIKMDLAVDMIYSYLTLKHSRDDSELGE